MSDLDDLIASIREALPSYNCAPCTADQLRQILDDRDRLKADAEFWHALANNTKLQLQETEDDRDRWRDTAKGAEVVVRQAQEMREKAEREATHFCLENQRMKRALKDAADWFNGYADSHFHKGDLEKGTRNLERAQFCYRHAGDFEHILARDANFARLERELADMTRERDEARAAVKRLREALRPFSELLEHAPTPDADDDEPFVERCVTYGPLWRARAALEGGE